MPCRFFSTFAVVILFCETLDGHQTARDLEKEQAIWSNLTAVAPGAVETFQRATAAMDKEDYAQAAQLYREVMKQAPQFSPVVRRLGICHGALGQTDEALALLQNAVKIERSPENLISLARTLAYPGKDKESTQAQKEIAFSLAKEASEQYQGSDDSSYLSMVAQLALSLEKTADFRQALERLVQKYPDQIGTRYFNAIRFAMDEDWMEHGRLTRFASCPEPRWPSTNVAPTASAGKT